MVHILAQTLHLATTTTPYGFGRSPWRLGGSGVLGVGTWYIDALGPRPRGNYEGLAY